MFLCVVVGRGVEGRGAAWNPQPRGSAQTHIKVRAYQLSGGGETVLNLHPLSICGSMCIRGEAWSNQQLYEWGGPGHMNSHNRMLCYH